MRKLSTAVILLLTFCLYAKAQNKSSADSARVLLSALKSAKNDTGRVGILLSLGNHYLNKPGKSKTNLDSAMNSINAALKLSREGNFKKGELKALLLLGYLYMETGDFEQGKSCYLKVADYYHSRGDKLNEALTWNEYGHEFGYNDVPRLEARGNAFKNAWNLFKQIPGKQIEVTTAYKDMADVHYNQGKYQLAETELLQVAAQFEKIHYKKLYQTYYLLGILYKQTGNFEKQLFYDLECVKSLDQDPAVEPWERGLYYGEVGAAYYALKDYNQSIFFQTKELEISKRSNFDGFYSVVTGIVYNLAASKGPAAALAFLGKQQSIHPPQTDYDKEAVVRLELRYNLELKRYKEAGRITTAAVKIYPGQLQKSVRDNDYTFFINHVFTVCLITAYYLKTNQNNKAELLLNQLLSLPLRRVTPIPRATIYSLQYKMDSIRGDFSSALRNYSKLALLKDSIAYFEKNEQVARMNARFKTYQKEQSIQLLNKKNNDQQVSLQKAEIRQKYIIGVGAMLFIIVGLLCYGLRNKQRINKKLKAQQQKIDQINSSLQQAVLEKDSLLIEKDWLLKEVNHRVKNNLHMVISLLESQAMYLKNDALKAMQTSKHRIFSMSLIHQKLYQSENVKTIDMSVYLPELIDYLRDSFDVGKYIHFSLEIEPVQLSISQAIPVALILNEAITNAVKYAFPDKRPGEISIIMRQSDETIELVIRDNGIGMATLAAGSDADSLGLKLIRGLIGEINGQGHFHNKNGMMITITFHIDLLIEKLPTVT